MCSRASLSERITNKVKPITETMEIVDEDVYDQLVN